MSKSIDFEDQCDITLPFTLKGHMESPPPQLFVALRTTSHISSTSPSSANSRWQTHVVTATERQQLWEHFSFTRGSLFDKDKDMVL